MANKKHVLIIEDEAALRDAIVTKFKESGYDVTAVNNGQDGVDAAAKTHFDVILCDIVMPVMDGFQAIEAMKKNGVKSPIITISNLNDREERNRAKKLGAAEYIVKSEVSLDEVVEKIKKY